MSQIYLSQKDKNFLATWYEPRIIDNTKIWKDTFWDWFFGLFGNQAVTLNKTIYISINAPLNNDKKYLVLLAHEFYHVVEQYKYGWWKYLFKYVKNFPRYWKQPYLHPMEKSAYERGEEASKLLIHHNG